LAVILTFPKELSSFFFTQEEILAGAVVGVGRRFGKPGFEVFSKSRDWWPIPGRKLAILRVGRRLARGLLKWAGGSGGRRILRLERHVKQPNSNNQ